MQYKKILTQNIRQDSLVFNGIRKSYTVITGINGEGVFNPVYLFPGCLLGISVFQNDFQRKTGKSGIFQRNTGMDGIPVLTVYRYGRYTGMDGILM